MRTSWQIDFSDIFFEDNVLIWSDLMTLVPEAYISGWSLSHVLIAVKLHLAKYKATFTSPLQNFISIYGLTYAYKL